MHSPNYSRLLQNFLEPNPQPLPPTDFEDSHSAVDLVEFLGEELLFSETIPAQPPTLSKLPKSLPLSLRKALKASGITHLYSHQLETLEALREGKDVILSTTTASGKSLSAYLPILEGVLQHNYTALSLYGLKALTTDQEQKLSELVQFLPKDERPNIAMLNGDVSKSRREQLLAQSPSLIAATPELIHYALRGMYWSQPLQQFLKQLRYVLLDEAHTLQGSYGANMALLLQRLKLAVDRYGGNSRQLQFIFLSATVGNPRQLARRLTGRRSRKQAKRLVWIKNSGAASPERQLIVTKPSLNPNPDVAKIILFLLRRGLSGICFCNGRATLKNLLGTLSKEAVAQGYPGIEQQVALFYGGLSNERRTEIIEQLQRGQVRCILST
jgi:DEAD/DEAH box helicase domain-containing protein